MMFFDQLRRSDSRLRSLTWGIFAGLLMLLVGLWWIQIVSGRDYEANLQTQAFRTVRVPAVRGMITDRNGVPLAENRPVYNICLYLEELRPSFDAAFTAKARWVRTNLQAQMVAEEHRLGRVLTPAEQKAFTLTLSKKNALREEARFAVASNIVFNLGLQLQQPLSLDADRFLRHYRARLYVPYPVLADLNDQQVARFLEQSTGTIGVDLEMQSVRVYPHGATAAHVLGYLRFDDSSAEGEDASFSYRFPDYRGLVGIEAGYDKELRGRAGAKSILVNNLGYRQAESVWSEVEPGQNVRLALDLHIQQVAEKALAVYGPDTRGAAVVMDVHSGDIVAMVSSPAIDPNHFVHGFPLGEGQRLNDQKLRPLINRATQENYPPGSIFKPLVGLAALEAGLDPEALYRVQPHPMRPHHGCIYVGRRLIEDLAEPGDYDLRRAILRSSNAYFINNGLRFGGVEAIIKLSQRFCLGERAGLPTRQEAKGILPTLPQVSSGWSDGDTANICIGQGHVAVTPLQMAVMTAAIANGGRVLWPRLVDHVEPPQLENAPPAKVQPLGRVRNQLGLSPQHLARVREAMLADVEDPHGTGTQAAVSGYRVSGKTGTAQVMNTRNQLTDLITWFVSFAPYEQPNYAVVVMVESGAAGGSTCAPIAREIYLALRDRDHASNLAAANYLRETPPRTN